MHGQTNIIFMRKKLINATTAYSYDGESIFHLIALQYYLQIFFKA